MKVPERYRVAGNSICGGMGDIYACSDKHLDRKVVFKVLRAGQDSRRLFDEQKALLQVRSKHVVQLYDIVEVELGGERTNALVLEFIDGDLLKIGDFAADSRLLNVLWQVACGLKEIHEAGVIHRDIKPANIIIDRAGTVKILDFGLSRNEGVEASTISKIGTPIFMAPELWGDQEISFDKNVDVYAFSIMALALLKGTRMPKELAEYPPRQIQEGALTPYFAGFPGDVISMLEACLNNSPEKRPTASLIEETLKKHLLHNRHRALLVAEDTVHELHSGSVQANIKIGTLGSISIKYTGTEFVVSGYSGAVTVNNSPINIGMELPACCVITFGVGSVRKFITFDVSNPEVMP